MPTNLENSVAWVMSWKVMTNLDSVLKSRDITLSTKDCLDKAMVFPVVMYGCESWTIKKADHQRIDAFELWVLDKTLESPLDCKEIQPVHPKGDQSWVFTGRTDAEADTPILWPPDGKDWLSWNDPDDGNDWRWEERRMTEWDGWMASATQWTWVWVSSGSYDGQGGLACCSPWGRKSQTQLSDWTKLSPILYILVYISNCFENVFMGVQLNVSPQSIQKLKHHLPLPTTEFFQITDSSSVIRSLTCSIVSSFLNFKVLLLFALLPMVFI